ncbi:LysR family transcriptional regulator [Paenibacillus woosongensis]|uniref:Transcriptional regulator n=1 Tax=Paenibacillus woosongensis TaxID=307580 RepID=A0ABQ4MTN3_9BACL|nr:LysR family transcriptional regulator [Paenibacillus woosongensis]GIP59276.1 transcriptional regulator [Paenibacillus woosongensis]
MNFEQMEYIKAIVHAKSISVAAEQLHVSQSAVSQSIAALEQELGLRLFQRSRLGTTPTEEGRSIINKALIIVDTMQRIKEDAQSITSSFTGELKIAAISSLMTFLPRVLSRFKKDFPLMKVTIIEMESKKIIPRIKQHTVDIGYITIPKSQEQSLPEHILFKKLDYDAHIKVIVPQDSPFAFQSSLRLQDLADYPIVMYASQFWENFSHSYAEKYGPLNILFYSSNSEVIKKTVAEGLAISLLSGYSLNDDPYVESGRIIPVHLSDNQVVSDLYFGCLVSEQNPRYAVIQRLLDDYTLLK